jgi:hypothetical protein
LALVAASPVLGCGHCIEDQVAAVYDHGIVTRALNQRHQIAFFSIAGPLPAGAESRRVIATAMASARGVETPTLRVSVDSASLSLAYDNHRISPNQIRDTLNLKLQARGLSVSLLRVMEQHPESALAAPGLHD